jgi:hypothetical protein
MPTRVPPQSSRWGEMRGRAIGQRRQAMLHVRVSGAAPVTERVADRAAALPGAEHVTLVAQQALTRRRPA